MSEQVYRFRIRCNATGEIREDVHPVYDWEREMSREEQIEGTLFQWTEGNYACDCNRELFFRRLGNEDFDEEAVECLPSGRYTVIDMTMPDGEVIPVDSEADA